MSDKVNWGILSTAHINRRVIPALRQSSRSVLRAVASRNSQKARDYANQWEIDEAYGSYEELLADQEIDVIYISLPNDLHTEWAIKCMRAGKHVLCEKPLCLTLEELESLRKVQEETGKYVSEAFMYLHHPQTKLFKKLIDDGRLGELRSMQSTFTFNFSRGSDNYRLAAEIGGGSLWDVGVYPISFFQMLTGNVPVECKGYGYPEGIDTRFAAVLRYPGNIIGQFYVSFETAFSTRTIILGSKGLLTITHPFTHPDQCKAVIISDDDTSDELVLPHEYLYLREVEDMNDVVLNGTAPAISLDQSKRHIDTVLRLKNAVMS